MGSGIKNFSIYFIACLFCVILIVLCSVQLVSATTFEQAKSNQSRIDLEADNIKYDSAGIAYAKGNVIIESLDIMSNERIHIEAQDVVFNKSEMDLKVKGDVRLTISPSAILLQGKDLYFNGLSNVGSMKSVSGRIPGFTQPRKQFSINSYYLQDTIAPIVEFDTTDEYLQSGDELYVFDADLEIVPNKTSNFALVLKNATVTNTRRKDSDLRLKVKNMTYIPNMKVTMRGITPILEDRRLFTLPRFSKSFAPKNKSFSWSTPTFSRTNATGWNISMNPYYYNDGYIVYFPVTYSEKRELFGGVEAVIPIQNGELGYLTSKTGKSLSYDIDGNPVMVTDQDNIGYVVGAGIKSEIFNWWALKLNYGGLSEQRIDEDYYFPRRETRRFAIQADLAFDPVKIAKNVELNSRFCGKRIQYSYTDRALNEFTYNLELVNKSRIGVNSLGYIRRLRTKNTGLLIDRNFPENTLTSKYRFRLSDQWLGQFSTYYNFKNNEFDMAQISAIKMMNGYSIRFSYDFANNMPMMMFELKGKDYYNRGRKIDLDNDALQWPIASNESKF